MLPMQPNEQQPTESPALRLAWWRSSTKRLTKHFTTDGITTACKRPLPRQAHITGTEPQWYLKGNCYNCARHFYDQYRALGYHCPDGGKDFPPRRLCPHGRLSAYCTQCTPAAAQNWPCPKGCSDPRDHEPFHRYTKCTIQPPRRKELCEGNCQTVEAVIHEANPGFFYDLADSASMNCYHCGNEVEGWWDK